MDELLDDQRVQLVSVCTPTDTHVEIGVRVLGAGKHLLIEKPVALSVEGMQPLVRAAGEGSGLRVMPAHCMRFWPGWGEARSIIHSGEWGRVTGGRFRRVGGVPDWNPGFYLDRARSGGPVFDLHVHDADYVLWCFGEPDALRCTGTARHFTTEYSYGDFAITAEAGWLEGSGVAFQMTFVLELEGCVLDFAYDREDPLRITHGGVTRAVPVATRSAYENQAAHLVGAIRDGRRNLLVTLADAVRVTALLEREAALLPE